MGMIVLDPNLMEGGRFKSYPVLFCVDVRRRTRRHPIEDGKVEGPCKSEAAQLYGLRRSLPMAPMHAVGRMVARSANLWVRKLKG